MLLGRQCNPLQTRPRSPYQPKMKHQGHPWLLLILPELAHSSGATQQAIYMLVGKLLVVTSPTKLAVDLTKTKPSSFHVPGFHRRQTKIKLSPSQSTMRKKFRIRIKLEALWELARPNPSMMVRTWPANRGERSLNFKLIQSRLSIACSKRWQYVGKTGKIKTCDKQNYLQKRIYRGIFN